MVTPDSKPFRVPISMREVLNKVEFCDPGYAGSVMLLAQINGLDAPPETFYWSDVTLPPELDHAVPGRRVEYLAGRLLGRLAMGHVDGRGTNIGRDAHRAPIWPSGVSGSISHSEGICMCLIVRDPQALVGIDIERTVQPQLFDDIARIVLTKPERELLQPLSPEQAAAQLTTVFSAKETLYKALYSKVQRFFGFECAVLVARVAEATVRLRLVTDLHPELPAGTVFNIRYRKRGEFVVTWLVEGATRAD